MTGIPYLTFFRVFIFLDNLGYHIDNYHAISVSKDVLQLIYLHSNLDLVHNCNDLYLISIGTVRVTFCGDYCYHIIMHAYLYNL